MPPGRKRKSRNLDVIKTEPDRRRATGRDDDDDFDDDVDVAREIELYPKRTYNSSGFSYNKRLKLRGSVVDNDGSFPFMKLPAEVRNMIYRYIVVSKAPGKIRLHNNATPFTPGGIEIAILLTNHQIFNEASKILYDENKCLAEYAQFQDGVALRKDNPKTKTTTTRVLRSGRAVDMVQYKGLIYEHLIQRLRHVEFRVEILDRSNLCDHLTIYYARRIHGWLVTLWDIIHCLSFTQKPTSKHGTHWEIIIHSEGHLGEQIMERLLCNVLQDSVFACVEQGKVKLVLEGKFPLSWKEMFFGFKGAGFITEKVQALDLRYADVEPVDDELDDIFAGVYDF